MNGISISRRLKTGLGSLAGIILVLAILAVGSTVYLLGQFSKYRAASDAAVAANDIAEDVFEAELAAEAFRSTPTPELSEEFDVNIDAISRQLQVLEAAIGADTTAQASLDTIESAKVAYADAFHNVKTLEMELTETAETMYLTGRDARMTLSELMDSANRAANAGQTFSASRVQESLLLGRVYMTRHVMSGSEETYETASNHLAEAAQQLSWMATMATDADRAELIASATADIAAFTETAVQVYIKTRDQGEAFSRMDQQRDLITGETNDLVSHLKNTLEETSQMMDTTFMLTALGLSGAAALALLFALFKARTTVRQVDREFDVTLNTVSELADGNLNVEIHGTEHQTELGSIARALEVFRGKSLEAEQLTRETEHARKRAAAEKEEREAQEREAKQRRQLEEQEATERRKREIFEALSAAVSGVVTAAAAGDFSRRVDASAVDQEMRGLAEDINRLMGNVENGLKEIAKVSERLADGDLREGMAGTFDGTFKALQANIDTMIGSLGSILAEISAEAAVVAQQSAEMTAGAEDLSRRAESQAASLEETSASMTEIASSAESNANSAAETDTAAANMNKEAGRAREVLGSTVSAMHDIQKGSKEIEAIVDVIEDIAFQTNLLSLNASVEAARAGEAGKGFAVVANEVRALAQRSAEASSKVQAIITQSTSAISRGSDAVEQTGTALEQIVGRIEVVSANLREIKSASEEQATAVKDISNAFGQLDKITQKNAAIAEQTRGTAGLLSSQSKRMQDAVGKVVLRQTSYSSTAGEAEPTHRSVA